MLFKQILCVILMACILCLARPISPQHSQMELLHDETSTSGTDDEVENVLSGRQLIDPISQLAKDMKPQHESPDPASSLPKSENSHVGKREKTDVGLSVKCMFFFLVDKECQELANKPVPLKKSKMKQLHRKQKHTAKVAVGEIDHAGQVRGKEKGSSRKKALGRRSDWEHFWKCITRLGYPC